MSRFLIIPHAPATPLRTRARELAQALVTNGHHVDIYKWNLQPKGLSILEKIIWHIREMWPVLRFQSLAQDMRYLTTPTAHRGRALAQVLEALSLRLLSHEKYDFVIDSSYGGLAPRPSKNRKLVYDLVDDHASGLEQVGDIEGAALAARHVDRAIANADSIITSSLVLSKLVSTRYGRNATFIPNGARVQQIRQAVAFATRVPLRIGYVGGLEDFVKIDLMIAAIEILHKGGCAAELFVVGDGPAIRHLRTIPTWVKLLGFRPPDEIPALLGTFHVGVVPFTISPFTDAALPLKVLEYGAARCLCVSAPLEELKLHNFPWVLLAEQNETAWATLLAKALVTGWEQKWDLIVDDFDWNVSAKKLLGCIS